MRGLGEYWIGYIVCTLGVCPDWGLIIVGEQLFNFDVSQRVFVYYRTFLLLDSNIRTFTESHFCRIIQLLFMGVKARKHPILKTPFQSRFLNQAIGKVSK